MLAYALYLLFIRDGKERKKKKKKKKIKTDIFMDSVLDFEKG